MRDLPTEAHGAKRVAHYGGSFNPVHEGHVAVARQLMERYGFHRVVISPTSERYAKAGMAADRVRLDMLEAAFAEVAGARVDAGELFQDGPTSTMASLERVAASARAELGDCTVHCVRGLDAVAAMATWRSLPELAARFPLVVVPRPQQAADDLEEVLGSRLELRAVEGNLWVARELDVPAFSSTAIRRTIMLEGVVPPSVPPEAARILRRTGAYGLAGAGQGWISLYRPGYSGSSKHRRDTQRRDLYGVDTWRTAFRWGERVISYDQALQLYEDAYLAHFEATPEVLWWLLRTAFDVFDNSESNVLSGLDYRIQEAPTTHLQDIAVRRCVMRLGARFAGDHLVEIRARDSEGFALNPGQVPFHRPDLIVEPQPRSWWLADSVEAFWQANKVFQVREGVFGPDRPLIVHLLGFDSDGHVCVGKDAGLSLPQVVFTGDGAFAECARRALASWPLDPSDALPLLATPVQAEDGAIHVLWRLPSVSEARSDLRAVTVQQLASSRLASPLRALLKQARRAEGAALA